MSDETTGARIANDLAPVIHKAMVLAARTGVPGAGQAEHIALGVARAIDAALKRQWDSGLSSTAYGAEKDAHNATLDTLEQLHEAVLSGEEARIEAAMAAALFAL